MNAHTRAEALRLVDQIRRDVSWLCGTPGEHAASNCEKLRALLSASDNGWRTMESAPRDATPVDLWRHGERLTNYRRVKLAPDNVFYEPVESGYSCVRDAEYWRTLPPPPNGETE